MASQTAAHLYPPWLVGQHFEQLATTHIASAAGLGATPAPAPYAGSPYATPAPAPYATPAPAPYATPYGGTATPYGGTAAPAGYALPVAPPDNRAVLIVPSVAVTAALIFALALVFVVVSDRAQPTTAPAPAPLAVAPADPSSLPPAWVEQPTARDAEGLLIVGKGSAANAELASEAARIEAVLPRRLTS